MFSDGDWAAQDRKKYTMNSQELAEALADGDLGDTYYETLILDDGPAWWACNLDGREIDPNTGGCPEHAPRNVPGLHRAECEATPPHAPVWVLDGDHCGYGVPCPTCIQNDLSQQLAKATRTDRCYHGGWHRWKATGRAVRWLYALGVISGSGWSYGGGHDGCVTFRFDLHRRPYILGVSRDVWRCWLVGRHRRGEEVGFGFCGKCVPWPCCGSQTLEHTDGCPDVDQVAVTS